MMSQRSVKAEFTGWTRAAHQQATHGTAGAAGAHTRTSTQDDPSIQDHRTAGSDFFVQRGRAFYPPVFTLNSGLPNSTGSSFSTSTATICPDTTAGISLKTFIASIMQTVVSALM